MLSMRPPNAPPACAWGQTGSAVTLLGVMALFTRTTGLFIVPLWLASIGWLIAHDVWPGLTAQDAPVLRVTDWLEGAGRRAQFAIYNDMGRLGTIWTEYIIEDQSIQRMDTVFIDGAGLEIFPLRMTIDSVFTADGILDELTARFENSQGGMRLHGERFPSDFSFTLDSGPVRRSFKIPLAEGGLISGAFNPFAQINDVQVGQRWRMQVFNPVGVLTGFGDRFIPMVVEVTGEETIATSNGVVKCLVVQAAHAKAWVDAQGAVQVQEVTLPLVGRIRVVREAGYDDEARYKARRLQLWDRRRHRR